MNAELLFGVVSFVCTVVLGLLRLLDQSRREEQERRFRTEAEKAEKATKDLVEFQRETRLKQEALAERLRLDELETLKLDGRLKLAEQVQSQAASALSDIRDTMVHRREFETWTQTVTAQLHEMSKLLREGVADRRRGSGSAPSSGDSTPRMPAIR